MPIPIGYDLNVGDEVLITNLPAYGVSGVVVIPITNTPSSTPIARIKTNIGRTTDFYWSQLDIDPKEIQMKEDVKKYPQGIDGLRTYGRKVQI